MNGVYVPAISRRMPRWSASWSSQVDFFQVATIMLNVAEQNSMHTSDRAYKPESGREPVERQRRRWRAARAGCRR